MKLSKFILTKVLGWKIEDNAPNVDKCVIVVAPHTSNWDFVIGKLAYTAIGRKASFLIKKEWFFFPFNIFFNSIGGIPVNRGNSASMTDRMAAEFDKHEKLHLAITPEGTRKPIKKWKKGFYFIATKANVPIILIGLDYGRKIASTIALIEPTGNYFADLEIIKSHYRGIKAKYPENFII